ncbi:MAG: Ig-like domain-containing protein, partial [Thermodesulfobacteriota bacterium]|nr:Ig-like domain-containing protein [Thermodesulfobacteriota bacterium]
MGTKVHFLGRNAFVLLVTFMFLCFGSVAFAAPPKLAHIVDKKVDEGQTLNFTVSATDHDNDFLTLTPSNLPDDASFTDNGNGTGTFTWNTDFTDDGNYPGVTFTASDGNIADDDTETITITVNNINRTPVAEDDVVSMLEEDTFNGDVLLDNGGQGTDKLGDEPSTVNLVGDVSHGTLELTSLGTFTYTPDSNYNGTDSFTYTITDSDPETSNVATVTIHIIPKNDTPVAQNDSDTTEEGIPVIINVIANDTDSDGTIDPTTVSVTSGPTNGSAVANADGTVTYTPDTAYIGTDTFTYTVNDNEGAASNAATVTVTVNAIANQPPTALDDA